MTPRERVDAALRGERLDRPLFCPAVYEHKARLIESTPGQLAQSAELLTKALFAEYEVYRPDMLTVGVDVYNIEAEALGCRVLFSNAPDAVPAIGDRLLSGVSDMDKLKPVDPEQDGRMPLMLEAATRVHEKVGNEVYVRGSVSAPYSIAAELLGIEPLIMACVMERKAVERLLAFCTDVAIGYGKAFLRRGAEVCIFDSQTAPPLMSPDLYGQLVLPHVQRLIKELKNAGAAFVEYVVGGDTRANADNLFATGADILLADFAADVGLFLDRTRERGCLIRRNISPILVENGAEEDLIAAVKEAVRLAYDNPQVVVGTGVLSYNTPENRVLLVREQVLKGQEA